MRKVGLEYLTRTIHLDERTDDRVEGKRQVTYLLSLDE